MTDLPFDQGLQPERTLLAWRRTCLSLAVGGAIGLRLAGRLDFGAIMAAVVCILSIAAAVSARVSAGWRYQRMHASLVASGQHVEGALPLILLSAAALLLAVGAVFFLLFLGPVKL